MLGQVQKALTASLPFSIITPGTIRTRASPNMPPDIWFVVNDLVSYHETRKFYHFGDCNYFYRHVLFGLRSFLLGPPSPYRRRYGTHSSGEPHGPLSRLSQAPLRHSDSKRSYSLAVHHRCCLYILVLAKLGLQ